MTAMLSPIGGITGLRGWENPTPEATPEQRSGDIADPRHAQLGEVAEPYPWEAFPGIGHGPYGPDNQLLGDSADAVLSLPASEVRDDPTMDQSPVRSHAAPWPRGLPKSGDPNDVEQWRAEQTDIHASNLGASREAQEIPTAEPVQDYWSAVDDTSPGVLFPQLQEVPGQIKSSGAGGWGSRDRVQSYAEQNGYGFDSHHLFRRFAHGAIPGNYNWMTAGQRPLIKSIPGGAIIPVGADSPFAGQDPGQSYDAQGAALLVLPATYQVPPDPQVAQSYPVNVLEPDTSGGGLW